MSNVITLEYNIFANGINREGSVEVPEGFSDFDIRRLLSERTGANLDGLVVDRVGDKVVVREEAIYG